MNPQDVKPIRPSTPSGKQLRPGTAWVCYVNFCAGLGMRAIPNTSKLAMEVGLEMQAVQREQNKALEILQKENAKLRRQVNHFSGRSFLRRIAGVFVRPRHEEEDNDPKKYSYRGICLACGQVCGPYEMTAREAGIRTFGDKCTCGVVGHILYGDENADFPKVAVVFDGKEVVNK